MRSIMIAAVVAAGLGLCFTASSFAAPVNGTAIGKAASTNHAVKKAHWRHWRYHWRYHNHRYWR
jgi:hypothetical protein